MRKEVRIGILAQNKCGLSQVILLRPVYSGHVLNAAEISAARWAPLNSAHETCEWRGGKNYLHRVNWISPG